MNKAKNIFTGIDNFIFNNFTKKKLNDSSKSKRNIYICNVDCHCNISIHYRSKTELNRLFNHLKKYHQAKLNESLINYLAVNSNFIELSSNCKDISEYLEIEIFPHVISSQKPFINFSNQQSAISTETPNFLIDLKKVDLSRLDQIILEKSVYDHVPLSKICNPNFSKFIGEFMKLGYEIKQSTNIDKNEFLKICNNLKISRTLLDEVGNDYFEASLSYFIGSDAAFQIDAGTVNKKKFLVFIISAKQRCPFSFLFDIDMNFDPTLNGYRKSVYDRIKKAKEKGINIIGIVSDNLPVQIKAISHESKCSIQKKYTDVSCIIHLRCCNHLLNLAYRDWIKFDNELTDYETNVKKISIILNNQKFYRYIKKKYQFQILQDGIQLINLSKKS